MPRRARSFRAIMGAPRGVEQHDYRVSLPKYPSKDPHYRILAHQRSRFTHYYFYIRDEVLGPMVLLRVEEVLPRWRAT